MFIKLPVGSFSVTHAPLPCGTTDFNTATKNDTFSNKSPFWSLLSSLPFTSSEIQQPSPVSLKIDNRINGIPHNSKK